MRIGEDYNISIFAQEQLSIEVIRAQRMTELEQLAKYRAIKLQKYKDWADPIKRAEMQAEFEGHKKEGLAILAAKDKELVDSVAERLKYYESIGVRENVKPLRITEKPTVVEKKKPWYRRIFG